MVLFINPANRAPGIHTGPAPGASLGKYKKNLLLWNHKAKSFHILCVAVFSGPLYKKVQVGKDQEKAQSERDSHSKNRGGKKPN